MKLAMGELSILRLAAKDAGADGWAHVSKIVWPLIASVPDELLEKRETETGGDVRITEQGKIVLKYS